MKKKEKITLTFSSHDCPVVIVLNLGSPSEVCILHLEILKYSSYLLSFFSSLLTHTNTYNRPTTRIFKHPRLKKNHSRALPQ